MSMKNSPRLHKEFAEMNMENSPRADPVVLIVRQRRLIPGGIQLGPSAGQTEPTAIFFAALLVHRRLHEVAGVRADSPAHSANSS